MSSAQATAEATKSQVTDALQSIQEAAVDTMIYKQTIVDWDAPVGRAIQQGDVYLVSIPMNDVEGTAIELLDADAGSQAEDRQLAPGNTPGSRHVLSGDISLYRQHNIDGDYLQSLLKLDEPVNDSLIGKAFVTRSVTVLTHPQHKHFRMPADRCIVTVGQQVRTGRVND